MLFSVSAINAQTKIWKFQNNASTGPLSAPAAASGAIVTAAILMLAVVNFMFIVIMVLIFIKLKLQVLT